MDLFRSAPLLAGLLLSVGSLSAADLSKIDRSIAREPAYRNGNPRYCLLVFGPEARFRVWVVKDGNDTYVDRNGNGNLCDPGERIEGSGCGTLTEPDGSTHKNLRVFSWSKGMRLTLDVKGSLKQFVGYDRETPLVFSASAKDAPIIHFGGPLEIRFYRDPPTLIPGEENEIDLAIGTPGLGRGTLAAVGCCNLPEKVQLRARFEAERKAGQRFAAEVSVGDD